MPTKPWEHMDPVAAAHVKGLMEKGQKRAAEEAVEHYDRAVRQRAAKARPNMVRLPPGAKTAGEAADLAKSGATPKYNAPDKSEVVVVVDKPLVNTLRNRPAAASPSPVTVVEDAAPPNKPLPEGAPKKKSETPTPVPRLENLSVHFFYSFSCFFGRSAPTPPPTPSAPSRTAALCTVQDLRLNIFFGGRPFGAICPPPPPVSGAQCWGQQLLSEGSCVISFNYGFLPLC